MVPSPASGFYHKVRRLDGKRLYPLFVLTWLTKDYLVGAKFGIAEVKLDEEGPFLPGLGILSCKRMPPAVISS